MLHVSLFLSSNLILLDNRHVNVGLAFFIPVVVECRSNDACQEWERSIGPRDTIRKNMRADGQASLLLLVNTAVEKLDDDGPCKRRAIETQSDKMRVPKRYQLKTGHFDRSLQSVGFVQDCRNGKISRRYAGLTRTEVAPATAVQD